MAKATAQRQKLSHLAYDRTGFSDDQLRDIYRAILLPRMIEEKMLILLRSGKISKWFSGIGQEGIATGATLALQETDYILPLHRNLGVFTNRNVPLTQLFAQWQGKREGFTKGRDRSFHFGAPQHRIIGMISHLGAMLPVANGISLASNLDREDIISLVFSGDGGASEGDFHEALNVAAVWDLPVIFLIENNGYGLSTPSVDQFRCRQFLDKAIGYGIKGHQVDGNNVLAVHRAVSQIAAQMRQDRKPVILEALTFRMRGHEEASGTKYVPPELFAEWGKKDPVINYETWLESEGILTETDIAEIRKSFKTKINQHLDETFALPDIVAELAPETGDVYASFALPDVEAPAPGERDIRFVDACGEGLRQALERDDKLVMMGQDIAEYGGVFKVSEGFVEQFGRDRIRNTPICESAILGAGLGLSIRGRTSVVEMQFADFVSCGFNQIVNNLAKTHYRWDQPVRITVRMPTGAGVAAGPFHSQSNEGWFAKVPGLKLVYPSNPYDAKGLLTTAILDPNPVIFFEHKVLYRSIAGPVPEAYYNLPLGKAAIAQSGSDLTIVTYGWGVHWAKAATAEFPDASIEIVDLRTLIPWDKETVRESVKKTNKCLVLHEDTRTLGIGAEIAAVVADEMFTYLDGPVKRVASLDTPVPFNKNLEDQFLGTHRLNATLRALLEY
ncbi:MAG: dehydrogenase E1 component subunit alpha/beta [Bacteroidota bacterium]